MIIETIELNVTMYSLTQYNLRSKKDRIALIIIDLQNDFISGNLATKNSSSKQDGVEIIPKINSLLLYSDFFKRIVITKDWHPKNHISFHSNRHIYSSFNGGRFNKIKIEKAKLFDCVTLKFPETTTFSSILWPDHCIQNSYGAELHKDLNTNYPHTIIHKGSNPKSDSYSAFWDNNGENDTGLNNLLTKDSVTMILLCGIALDYCVEFTARDAVKL
ncbi:hypothetical protein HZS_4014, partial [Henneguya salminicola]